MKSLANKVLWKIISSVVLLLLLYITIKYFMGDWTIQDVLDFLVDFIAYAFPIGLFLIVMYKSFIERILLSIGRKKTAEVIVNELPATIQVDGVKRSGKDASTTAESILVRELLMKRYKKEIKTTREKLYIYDFQKLDEWLTKNGKLFFVASQMRIVIVFKKMLIENDCFISDYWIKKGVSPKEHLKTWKYLKNKYVPDVPFEDGLTPGGKHMLDMLMRYVLIYIRYNFFPNYIMSNQPILEEYSIVGGKRIKRLFSKIFSQDFLKLKDPTTPMPFIFGLFIYESENAIFYSNTDKKIEVEIKEITGIREFHTIWGHLLQEEGWLRGLTQSKTRVNKALRELYEGYIHVFKMEFRATSDFSRSIIMFKIFMQKFKVFRLKIYSQLSKKIIGKKTFQRKQYKLRKSISLLHQKNLKKWAKGYIIFYKGYYDKLEDSGKSVKYPILWGLKKANTGSSYRTYGFKQINRIKDSFGRYNTHQMYTVREAKEKLVNVHFNDIPQWSGFEIQLDEIKYMNYRVFIEMITTTINYLKEAEKKKKIEANKIRQQRSSKELPNFTELSKTELMNLCIDFGSDKVKSTSAKTDLIKILIPLYSTFNKTKTSRT